MKNYIPLSEQEELSLKQLANQPGYPVIFKLLQQISLDAQAEAMDCKDADRNKRLMVLADAQATNDVVNRLIQKLARYQVLEQVQVMDEAAAIIANLWTKESN